MVFEKIKQILVDEFDLDPDVIQLDSTLTDELELDSIDLVDVVIDIEDMFEMELPDEDLEKMKTVGDLVKYIEEH